MAGFNNDVMWADNVRFDGGEFPGAVTTDAQLLIGSTAAPNIRVGTITSPGGTITIGYISPNITIDLAGGSVGVDSVAVQASTAPGTNPVLPTGAGLLTINGATVAAQLIPVRSNSIAANTLQIEVQRASSSAGTNATQQGLSSYNSAQFTVDANGWVSLAGGGLAIDQIAVDFATAPGVTPVDPDATGLVTYNGVAVAAQTIPVRTHSTALNQLQLEVQRASTSAVTNATQQGLSSFLSDQFTVDANGFVQLVNGQYMAGIAVDASTPPGTNPVLPDASGILAITATDVAAFGTPLRTNSIAINTILLEVQRSSAVAAPDATQNGVCHFDSADFTVDANGFVSAIAGTSPWLDSAGGALANHTGYFATAAAAYTLPAGVANGDMVEIVDVVGGGVVLTAAGADIIQIQNVASSAGGTATSTLAGDSLRLSFRLADLTWWAVPGAGGNWVLA